MWRSREQGSGKPVRSVGAKERSSFVLSISIMTGLSFSLCPYAIANLTLGASWGRGVWDVHRIRMRSSRRWPWRGSDWNEALWGCNLLVQERVGIRTREVHIKSKRESNSASHEKMSPSGHRA